MVAQQVPLIVVPEMLSCHGRTLPVTAGKEGEGKCEGVTNVQYYYIESSCIRTVSMGHGV